MPTRETLLPKTFLSQADKNLILEKAKAGVAIPPFETSRYTGISTPPRRRKKTFTLDREAFDKLGPAAKARGLTVRRLIGQIVRVVVKDDLINAVLDDRQMAVADE